MFVAICIAPVLKNLNQSRIESLWKSIYGIKEPFLYFHIVTKPKLKGNCKFIKSKSSNNISSKSIYFKEKLQFLFIIHTVFILLW